MISFVGCFMVSLVFIQYIINPNDSLIINFSLLWLIIKSLLVFLLVNFINFINEEKYCFKQFNS